MSEFVEVKTQDLIGAALDWAVAMAEKVDGFVTHKGRPAFEKEFDPDCWADDSCLKVFKCWQYYAPSAEWSQGGPLIEKYAVEFEWITDATIRAEVPACASSGYGNRHLTAACRAIVASVLGDTVSVPKELLS